MTPKYMEADFAKIFIDIARNFICRIAEMSTEGFGGFICMSLEVAASWVKCETLHYSTKFFFKHLLAFAKEQELKNASSVALGKLRSIFSVQRSGLFGGGKLFV